MKTIIAFKFLKTSTFRWIFPLFIKGFKNDLAEEHLYPVLQPHESRYLGDKLYVEWKKQLRKNPKNPSLWKALGGVFGKQMVFLGIFFLFIEIFIRSII